MRTRTDFLFILTFNLLLTEKHFQLHVVKMTRENLEMLRDAYYLCAIQNLVIYLSYAPRLIMFIHSTLLFTEPLQKNIRAHFFSIVVQACWRCRL